jgi:sugar transferase (PEP-CTERM/EpsH1 system associated)
LKVLILDEELPYPQDSGKRIRVHALLSRMAKRHDLTLLTFVENGQDDAGVACLQEHGIRVIGVRPPGREQRGGGFYLKLLMNLFSPLPFSSWNYCPARMQRRLRALLTRERFDLIHAEITLLAPLLRGIGDVPTVAVAHNVESEIWRRYEETEGSCVRRRYIALQRRRVERIETTGLCHLTVLCTVSERDAEWFRNQTTAQQVHVVPNGVDLDYFQPCTQPEEHNTLIHAGSMDWRPNVDAVMYFLREIYPSILQRAPDVQFLIVGRNPADSVASFASRYQGVHITGTVEDTRPFVCKSGVFVVPLRVGGGSRLKILNALAMGKAVVSTSIGAEGLDVEDGKHLLLADTPETFTERTVALLRDPAKRRRLGIAGRALVEARSGWDAVAGRLEGAWNAAVARHGFRR